MNFKSKIFYLALLVAGLLASCSKDFLNRPPLSEISTENFYQTTSDLKLGNRCFICRYALGRIYLYQLFDHR